MDDMSKASWPGWETVELIGRGSFGAVYRIRRDVLGDVEEAALKVISIPQNASDIEEMYSDGFDEESITSTFQNHLKSIVSEYSLMRKMNGSANVVNCDDIRYVRHDDGIGWDIYIKMELLTPLTKALPADIPEEMVVKVAQDLCAALKLCSKHEIVHRDIKPQNIFVSPNGDYKLGDFGIAKTVEKTTGGTKIGTYKYMAPEVYNNQPYGRSADIYSLGLVLYWMLNERRMPFLPLPPAKLGVGMDEQARIRRLSGEPIPAPANGSPKLKDIVLKACAYSPKERYTSPDEMMADLKALGEDSDAVAAVIPPIAVPQPVGAAERTASVLPNGAAGDDDATVGVFGVRAAAAAVPQLQEKKDEPVSSFRGSVDEENDATVGAFGRNDAPLDGESTIGVWGAAPKVHTAEAAGVAASRFLAEEEATIGPVKSEAPVVEEVDEAVAPVSDPVSVQEPTDEDIAVAPAFVPNDKPKQPKKKKTLWLGIAALVVAIMVLLLVRCDSGLSEQADWSEWMDVLPDYATDESYNIEERTLYRSRNLETTSSTVQSEMAGWELYDTVEGNGVFGEWSEWSASEVTGNENREVETQTRYHYRDKETTSSASASMPGWELADTTYTLGEYGSWSSWSTTAVSGSDSRKVETQTQYRYRDKETTTSQSSSLNGWVQYDVQYTYSYGEWQGWTRTPVQANSTTEVESVTVYDYVLDMYIDGVYSGTERMTYYYDPGVGVGGVMDEGDVGGEYYKWIVSSVTEATEYRYRTKTVTSTTYYFYRWTNWSNWSNAAVSSSSSREVQSQTLYRYCDREQIPTYHFMRWSDWSDWSLDAVTASDTRQVETTLYYHYREQQLATTYYFQRWGEWSEYSTTPIYANDTTEVESIKQYRFKLKEE